MKRVILFLSIFLIFCCKKDINDLEKDYFNYEKEYLNSFDSLANLNRLLDYKKEIILVKTDLFYISNIYVLPFFYFEFREYLKDSSNDFPLSKDEITEYFLYVAEARAINRLMFIESQNYLIQLTDEELNNSIKTFIEEELGADLENFKNDLQETMFTYTFFEKDRKESLLMEKYKESVILKDIEPSERELIDFYENNPSISTIKERVIVRHILVLTTNLNENEKKKKYELIKKIRNLAIEGSDFGELAKKYSDDQTTKKSGGKIGEFLERGQTFKEFEDAAFNTDEGKISDIIETVYGYHILKIDKKEKERKVSFEEVKDKIYELVKIDKEMELMENEKNRLKKKYNFKIVFKD